jgi:hypothetical protein
MNPDYTYRWAIFDGIKAIHEDQKIYKRKDSAKKAAQRFMIIVNNAYVHIGHGRPEKRKTNGR